MIKFTDILKEIIDKNSSLEEEKLSNLTKIEPYNNPEDEYSQDLDGYLKDDNIDWREESYITLLNPNQIKPSEWNSLSDDPKNPKSIKYSKLDPSKFPPILALKTGPNSYEVIDGIHRVYAFRLTNHMIPAIVITPKLEQGLSTNDTQMVNFMYNKYKDHNIPTPVIIKENMKKSQLRKLIKEEIQLLLERYINLFGKDEIKPYIYDIWDIMQRSYEPIGGFQTANSPEELLEKVWMAKLVRKEGKIVAAMLYKDKYGRKSIAAGSDGSEIGRQAVKQMMKEDSTQFRSWGEYSGKPEYLHLKYGGVPIPNNMVADILGKEILEYDPDGYHYTRLINGEPHRKIMIGNVQK